MSAMKELDALIDELDVVLQEKAGTGATQNTESGAALPVTGDALDVILAERPRTTQVGRLRDNEAVQQFRQDLVAGLVGMERLGQVLNLISSAVQMLLTRQSQAGK